MNETFTYVGAELDLFAAATQWKAYVHRHVAGYLNGAVLEVGAGFGGTTRRFCTGREPRWVGLEPDPVLAQRFADSVQAGELPACCEVRCGTLSELPANPEFDALLYMDVLEHIEDDSGELSRASAFLKPGGHVVVLSPAHQWLFTPFDKALGHFRRYAKSDLRGITPAGMRLSRLIYLDAVGMLASLGNRLLLKSELPTVGQIAFWDKFLVRCSKWVDPILGYTVGKSVLAVWRKD